jgi:hypothetical protein
VADAARPPALVGDEAQEVDVVEDQSRHGAS